MTFEQPDDQLTSSTSSSFSPAWMYSPVSSSSSAATPPLQFPIIRGAFSLRQPSKPLDWKWKCHFCGRLWRLATTRRCLRDGHYFCKVPKASRVLKVPRVSKIPRAPKSSVSSEMPRLERPQQPISPPFFCPPPPPYLDLSCFLRPSPRPEIPQPATTAPPSSSRQEISRSAITDVSIAGRDSSRREEASRASPTDQRDVLSAPELASDLVHLSAPLQPPPSIPSSCTSLSDDTPTPRSHRTPLPTQRIPLRASRFGPVARQTELLTARGSIFARPDHKLKRGNNIKKRGKLFCEGIFDRPGWKKANDWRRRVLRMKQTNEEEKENRIDDYAQVERNGKRKRDVDDDGRNCLIDCDFPMDCLIKQRQLNGPKDNNEKDKYKHDEEYRVENEDGYDEVDDEDNEEDDEDEDEDEDDYENEYQDDYEDEYEDEEMGEDDNGD